MTLLFLFSFFFLSNLKIIKSLKAFMNERKGVVKDILFSWFGTRKKRRKEEKKRKEGKEGCQKSTSQQPSFQFSPSRSVCSQRKEYTQLESAFSSL